ncbi:MAG: hypothetical protein U0835_13415 [Isosphaeraceae bacterium]
MTGTKNHLCDEVTAFLRGGNAWYVDGVRYVLVSPRVGTAPDGRSVLVSFGLVEASEAVSGVGDDPQSIQGLKQPLEPPNEFSARFHEWDAPSSAEDGELVVVRGPSRYSFTFPSAVPFEESRREFMGCVREAVHLTREGRAGELACVNAAIDAMLGASPEAAEVRAKGLQIVGALVKESDEYAWDARRWVGLYYLIGLVPFLFAVALRAASEGFSGLWALHSAGLFAAALLLLQTMKRILTFAQRQHSVSRVYREAAGRIAATTSQVQLTMEQLLEKQREEAHVIRAGVQSSQQSVPAFRLHPDLADHAISTMEPLPGGRGW